MSFLVVYDAVLMITILIIINREFCSLSRELQDVLGLCAVDDDCAVVK